MVRPASIDWVVPPALRPGQTVAVCAPAFAVKPARLAAGLALLAPHLRLRVDDGVYAQTGYLAGDDHRRADELNRLMADPDVRAIIVARGGFGITRILADLDPDLLRADPKPIVGFSDAIALLSWAAAARVRGIHGPVVSHLGDLPASDVHGLVSALTDPRPMGRVATLLPMAAGRSMAGPMIPANLKMLAHLVGTPWQLDPAAAILLIEEIGEKPYAIDRDLTQLELAGLLRDVRGVVAGDFIRCFEGASVVGAADDPQPALEVVARHLAAIRVAGWSGAPVGHGGRNVSLPFGGRCEIDEHGGWSMLDAAVA